ncbi:protein IMPACT isoform X5 [Rissa tridactyla]|uniref:protein IMPACT isoform X5 n=1 Tax=Rissa tridactyla TaxID=75485 RepID=UPI0023BAB7FB|nr:protein IMPACT isoform X5 [Rissa tridactyla]
MAAGETEAAQQQIDEIEALSSIYGEDWCVVDEDEKIYCIKINDCLDQPKWTLCLQVILPPGYPAAEPPIYQLNAPWLRGQDYVELANSLEEIYVYSSGKTFIQYKPLFHDLNTSDKKNSSIERQNLGESILYLWVEKIREVLIEKAQSSDPEPDIKKTSEEVDEDDGDDFLLDYQPIQEDSIKIVNYITSESQEVDEELPSIHHGSPITDRRSTFQAHLAPVVTPRQVKKVLEKLYENKKIASATHNIYAYRIYCEDKQTFLQDCEDDGETAAGGRLLHLMQEESSKQAGKSKKIRKDNKKRTEH